MDIMFRLPIIGNYIDDLAYGLYWVSIILAIIVFGFLIQSTYQQLRHKGSKPNKTDVMATKLDKIIELLSQKQISGGDNMSKSEPQPPLTKKKFEQLLTKAAQPISEWQHAQEEPGTSVAHPSDGCSETRKNQDRTEDKED